MRASGRMGGSKTGSTSPLLFASGSGYWCISTVPRTVAHRSERTLTPTQPNLLISLMKKKCGLKRGRRHVNDLSEITQVLGPH